MISRMRGARLAIAPEAFGVGENGSALTAAERQLRIAKLMEVAQQQPVQREAHIGPHATSHTPARQVEDAPPSVRRFTHVAKGTKEVVHPYYFDPGRAEQAATEMRPLPGRWESLPDQTLDIWSN